MPKLGESVTEGTLGTWLKQVGDSVDKYEPMVEVVTDKVTAEIPAPVSGTIVEIIGGEGDTIPVGGVICVIDEGNGATASVAAPADEQPQASHPAADASTPTVDELPTSTPMPSNGDLSAARERRDEQEMLRIRSSPLVRRLAEEHEIPLSELHGSGMGGRVTKSDIMAEIDRRNQPGKAAPAATPAPASPVQQLAPAAAEPATAQTVAPPMTAPAYAQPMPAAAAPIDIQLMPGDEVIEASIMRRQIAEHMVKSVQTAPHVTVWMEADMTNVVRARERFKAEFQQSEGINLTYLPFVMRVVTQTLRAHPNVNAAWDNGRIIRRKALNIGIAVALEDGLIVPVLRDADERNVVGLARAINDLATRAQANRLQPDDVTGGTFTVNNPGTLGSMFSTPIIVQPQAAILSMEAIVKRPVVIDDAIAIRPMMNLSLSIDHRILDGLAATRFLADVKRGLEEYPAEASIY
jgi:pyruvate/2-oxoglutarate dehydrogenase complex dihydrolipoamide acyltransferase (E2) component